MRNRLLVITLALAGLGLSACASVPRGPRESAGVPGLALVPQEADAPSGAETTADEDASRSFVTSALMYLPDRVLDLSDVAKVGVDVGLGLGIELKATHLAQAMALSTFAVGVGLEGLRHVPFRLGPEAAFGVGPLGGAAELGGWFRSATEFRVGVHLLVVGAHVSLDPAELLDFALGFFLIDIEDDDL